MSRAAAATKAKAPFESKVFRKKGQSYTCITVAADAKFVQFIPMSSLLLTKVERRLFEEQWEEFALYPVRRAAELYLGAGEFREICSKVSAQLAAIRDGAPSYTFEEPVLKPLPKEPTMATVAKKNPKAAKAAAPVKQPAATKAAKQPAAPKAEKQPSEGRGRKSNVDLTAKLTLLVKENPKRAGSASYDRFQAGYIASKAKTVEQAVAAGATLADIAYDAGKGFIKLG